MASERSATRRGSVPPFARRRAAVDRGRLDRRRRLAHDRRAPPADRARRASAALVRLPPSPTVATDARTLPGAAVGWPWIDATSSSQLWKRSAGSFISIRLITSKIRRSSAVMSGGVGIGSVMCL